MASFAAFPNALRNLCTMAILIIFLLILEVARMLRSVSSRCFYRYSGSQLHPKALSRFFRVLDERIPANAFEKASAPVPVECAVCMEELEEGEETRQLSCRHVFHKDCLDRWLERQLIVCTPSCPICRRTVMVTVLPDQETSITEVDDEQCESYSDEESALVSLALRGRSGSNLHRMLWG